MTTRLLLVALVIAAAVLVGLLARRRRPDPPTAAPRGLAPAQLDRKDFDRPDAPWLLVIFTSATCDACRGVLSRADALRSEQVAVVEVEFGQRRDLHDRYGIDSVPLTLLVDAEDVVVRSWLGPVSATHLWAGVAEAREPGSVPSGCEAAPAPEGQAEGGAAPSS
jgi:hypothetical protein